MPKRRSRKSPLSPDDVIQLANLIADMTPVVGDAKAVFEASKALQEEDYTTAALSAVGLIPFAGDAVAASLKAARKADFGDAANVVSRTDRDMPNLRTADRKAGLADQFMEQHGYELHMGGEARPKGPHYEPNQSGGVTAYTPYVDAQGRAGMEQKSFDNPTLGQLRKWMNY